MNNRGRPRSNSAPAVMTAQQQRLTTFLTVTQDPAVDRAPSAYRVEPDTAPTGMRSQRSRQEHPGDGGAVNTGVLPTVHAFTSTQHMQGVVADLAEGTAHRTGMDPSMALRLEIMDGLASPTASAGAQHIEAFTGQAPAEWNPHISGGTVQFAQPGSLLGDFDAVHARTAHNQAAAPHNQLPPIPAAQGATNNITPEAQRFNTAAVQAQTNFARQLLGGDE